MKWVCPWTVWYNACFHNVVSHLEWRSEPVSGQENLLDEHIWDEEVHRSHAAYFPAVSWGTIYWSNFKTYIITFWICAGFKWPKLPSLTIGAKKQFNGWYLLVLFLKQLWTLLNWDVQHSPRMETVTTTRGGSKMLWRQTPSLFLTLIMTHGAFCVTSQEKLKDNYACMATGEQLTALSRFSAVYIADVPVWQ